MIGIADELLRKMTSHRSVSRASLAGSLRRKMEVVRNINLVVSTSRPQEVLAACSKFPEVEVVRLGNEAEGLYSLLSGIEVELRTVSEEAFPHSLFHRTGSLSHWRSMRRRAEAMGLELKEEGLQRDGRLIPCKEEEEIFGALGLDFIPPELREDQGEIEAAEFHQLPVLVRDQDIQGVFHIHSLYSDGTSPIKGMAEAARRMGFSYIGLTDHSQSAGYAGGLTPGRLQQQWAEVERNESRVGRIPNLQGDGGRHPL